MTDSVLGRKKNLFWGVANASIHFTNTSAPLPNNTSILEQLPKKLAKLVKTMKLITYSKKRELGGF